MRDPRGSGSPAWFYGNKQGGTADTVYSSLIQAQVCMGDFFRPEKASGRRTRRKKMVDFKADERLNTLNHSCAHVMAQAVKHLYPEAKFWVGPVVKEGFYYDIDLGDNAVNDDVIAAIEKEMKKICKEGKKIYRREISKAEALELFKNDEYKLDLISDLEIGSGASRYQHRRYSIFLIKIPHTLNKRCNRLHVTVDHLLHQLISHHKIRCTRIFIDQKYLCSCFHTFYHIRRL